jgi:hypothetical protein
MGRINTLTTEGTLDAWQTGVMRGGFVRRHPWLRRVPATDRETQQRHSQQNRPHSTHFGETTIVVKTAAQDDGSTQANSKPAK